MSKQIRRYDAEEARALRGLTSPIGDLEEYGVLDVFRKDVLKMFKDGYTRYEIVKFLKNLDEFEFSDETANVYFDQIQKEFSLSFITNRKQTVYLHLKRYQELIRDTLNPVVPDWMLGPDIPAYKIDEFYVNQYNECLYLLLQEEELFGLHQKKIKVFLNDLLKEQAFKGQEEKKEESILDQVDKLPMLERLRFLELLMKSKRTESELSSVVRMDYAEVVQEVIEELEEEDETPNIDYVGFIQEEKKTTPLPANLLDLQERLVRAVNREANKAFKNIKKNG